MVRKMLKHESAHDSKQPQDRFSCTLGMTGVIIDKCIAIILRTVMTKWVKASMRTVRSVQP